MPSTCCWEELTLTCLCDGAGTIVQPETIDTQEGSYSCVRTPTSQCVMLLRGAPVAPGEGMRRSCASAEFLQNEINLIARV